MQLVIFDLDGTILNTYSGVRQGIIYLQEKYHLEKLSEEALQTFIGPPISISLQKYYGLDAGYAEELMQEFRRYYATESLLSAENYEGMPEVLAQIRRHGINAAVATNKREDMAKRLLAHFGLSAYLNEICGSDATAKLTKAEIIKKVLLRFGITDSREVLMVGDSDNDALGAAELGIPFIAVTYGFGFHSAEDVEGFPHLGTVRRPAELLDWIL